MARRKFFVTVRKITRLVLLPLKIPWVLITLVLRTLWNPVLLGLFTAFVYYVAYNIKSFYSYSFSVSSAQSDNSFEYILIAVFAFYGLGVGTHITKWAATYTALSVFVVSASAAVLLLWYFAELGTNNGFTPFLFVTISLLMCISAGTAVVTVIRYLASREPGPVIPQVFSSIRSHVRATRSGIRWARSHTLIVALIGLQFAVNAFILYRMNDMEKRTGGKLFTTCNADQAVISIKNSIVRITSSEGEGTGMMVREDGYILTNAHIIADDPSPKIIFADYSFKTSKVIFRDKDKDIAVLKVEGTGYVPVSFGDPKHLAPRSALYSVGYPMGTEIRGDATTSHFIFTAIRNFKNIPTDMIQLEGVGTGGASGSPVITSCGEVVGMFTSGIEGISLAISSTSIRDTIGFLSGDPSVWPKPPEFTVEADKSSEEAVKAYYTFIKMRDFKRAYLMLTPERIKDIPLEKWEQGYAKTLDVTLIGVSKDDGTPTPTPTPKKGEPASPIIRSERVYVRIRSLDLEGQDIVIKYFEGPWIVVYDGEFWHLSDSNIKLVDKPGWDWFW